MATKKITELTNLATPAGADILAIVDDVAGTATTKKVTATNLMTLAPVQSVAGQTGTVTLSNTDISGLGTAATTNSTDYATATQGTKADTATQPGDLGTAAAQDVGTTANNIVQLDGSARLPAVDGSQLTGITATDSTKLAKTSNLSDLNNVTTARTNLGLGDAATKTVGTADTNVIAVSSGTVDLGGNTLEDFDASINDQTGTSYTLLSSDNGKVVVLDNASAVTVTVPSGLGAGFNCSFVQKGAGQVSFTASSTTIYNRQSHTKINAQYGVASLLAYAADTFVLAGDTAS